MDPKKQIEEEEEPTWDDSEATWDDSTLYYSKKFSKEIMGGQDSSAEETDEELDVYLGESDVDLGDTEVVEPDNDPPVKNPEAPPVVTNGELIAIHSRSQLKSMLTAASEASQLSVMYFLITGYHEEPCREVTLIAADLARKYPNVVFLKIDIDEISNRNEEQIVSFVPAFALLKNGKEVEQVLGCDENELEYKIAKHCG